jgi:hypothetical protein
MLGAGTFFNLVMAISGVAYAGHPHALCPPSRTGKLLSDLADVAAARLLDSVSKFFGTAVKFLGPVLNVPAFGKIYGCTLNRVVVSWLVAHVDLLGRAMRRCARRVPVRWTNG